MKKYLLVIFSLFFVLATADAASHREKKEKERWFDGPGKPKKHRCHKKAGEVATAVVAGVVNNSIEEYKKNKASR